MRDILIEQEFPSLNIGPGYANLEAQLPEDHIKITLDRYQKLGTFETLGSLRGIPNQHLINAAAEYMPFRDSSLPTITTQSTFQVMFDQKAFLSELSRILKPGGLFIITIEYGNIYDYYSQQFPISPHAENDDVDKLKVYIKSLGLHISFVKYLNLNGIWRDNKAEAFSMWIIGEKEEENGDSIHNSGC